MTFLKPAPSGLNVREPPASTEARQIGAGPGEGYTVKVPLSDGAITITCVHFDTGASIGFLSDHSNAGLNRLRYTSNCKSWEIVHPRKRLSVIVQLAACLPETLSSGPTTCLFAVLVKAIFLPGTPIFISLVTHSCFSLPESGTQVTEGY